MRLLAVVDFQKDFVDGSLGFPEANKLDDIITKKIEEYEASGGQVVYTLDTHHDNYRNTQEGKRLPIPHCIRGTEGWELYGKVGTHFSTESVRFEKPTFPSALFMNWLMVQAEQGTVYTSVELCGLVSNICVLSNAVMAKAALPEAEIIVDARACLGPDRKLHEEALDVMEGLQITVKNRE